MAKSTRHVADPHKREPGTLAQILAYIRPYQALVIMMVAFVLGSAIMSVVVPTVTKDIVNETQKGIAEGFDFEAIRRSVTLTVAAIAAAFACDLIKALVVPKLAQRTAQRLRFDLGDKVDRIPLAYFDTTPEGETLSTMTNDVDTLSSSLAAIFPGLISSVAMLAASTIVMLATNWVLALVTIVTSLAGMAISAAVLSRGGACFAQHQDLLAQLDAQVNEDVTGLLVIKSFNAEQDVMAAFECTNKALSASARTSEFVSALLGVAAGTANNLSYILVCIVGAALVLGGATDIATVIAFIAYISLFSTPIQKINDSMGAVRSAFAAAERIFAVLGRAEMADEGAHEVSPAQARGEVDFSHVRFGYLPQTTIVHDFSLHVSPGQKVAIVGPTGAGKSTVINLLERFYEADAGDIVIDGVSIYDMSRSTLHALVSMVLQDTWTFQGTIRENIVYAKQGVSDAELEEVVEACGLAALVSQSPQGLDTLLAEDADISVGQKQLITIARAMLDQAPILILDEATSSVDTRTEALIMQAIDRIVEGRTSFVIAHRLSTVRNADAILVLKDGDVAEMGTHDELMAQGGLYAELYQSQFDEA